MDNNKIANELLKIAKMLDNGKTASFTNESIMVKLLGDGFLDKLDARIKNSDQMTMDLVQEVYNKLSDRFDISHGEREAMEYLQAISESPGIKPDLVRNMVFKAAHALGIKLPSSMF